MRSRPSRPGSRFAPGEGSSGRGPRPRAEALLGLGAIEDRTAADECLLAADDGEHAQGSFRIQAVRALALYESAASERHRRGALDRAIEVAEAGANPLLLGALWEARAQVGDRCGNAGRAARCASQTEFWYRPAQPRAHRAVGRLDRVLHPPPDPNRETSANDVVTEMIGADTARHDTLSEVLSALSDCRTANARAERALEMLVESSGARAGLLYLLRRGALALAAPGHGGEPAVALERAAVSRLGQAQQSPDTASLGLQPVEDAATEGWSSALVACTSDGRTLLVGVLLLLAGEGGLQPPGESVTEAIAQRLAADVEQSPAPVSASGD
ncbi:MAG: hypothetical protein U0168_19565 [Nannocystaceae bacterium]